MLNKHIFTLISSILVMLKIRNKYRTAFMSLETVLIALLVTEIKIIRHNDTVINMLNHIRTLAAGIISLLDAMETMDSLACLVYHFP